jgi:hypothetical protein
MTQEPVRVFVGFDPRQPVGYSVLQSSLHRHSARRVQVEPLMLNKLPIKRRGLTEFTFSRFLVPYLCGYEGTAIFMDADIIVTGDIGELANQADGKSCVQVMMDQAKFEWASVMLFNNEHCKMLTPAFIDDESHNPLALDWGEVGSFGAEWNHCVGYMEPKDAKLYHYTQGLPCFHETQGLPEDEHWLREREHMLSTVSWGALMGKSKHAQHVLKRMLLRIGMDAQ